MKVINQKDIVFFFIWKGKSANNPADQAIKSSSVFILPSHFKVYKMRLTTNTLRKFSVHWVWARPAVDVCNFMLCQRI